MQPRLLKHPARLAGASLLRLQDDDRLVALAREGHDPAFAAIVDRYGRQLERYCARLLGPGRAEDAVQQAFVNAHIAMRTSDQELALKPWLYRIAHNAAMNILRTARDDDVVLDMDRPGAVATAEVVELRERLRETLASIQALPAAQRDALLLRELEGRSHEEIAAALGVSEGGARQHLHRARVSLRAAVSAVTPYPVIARLLNAAAAESGRSADLVSGAGLGAGAGAIKVAAGVLAAGAIAGGAVGVQHTRSPSPSAHAAQSRSTTAPSEANGPSATPLEVADHLSAGATPHRGRGHGRSGARGHGHGGRGDGRLLVGGRRTTGHDGTEHSSSGDHQGTSGSGKGGEDKSGSSHDGSSTLSGSSHDGTSTEASHEDPAGTTTDGSSTSTGGGSSDSTGSSDGSSTTSSGSDGGGETTTTTTSTDGSGGDALSGTSTSSTTDN